MIVGGGVIGDLAGFAAATFLRGLRVVQVPTTVVAQVDSAIGGKVGVNHARGKNLIGAFHPPIGVLIDPGLLATLPARELRAGLYEVVKYGVIADRRLFVRLERDLDAILARDPEALVPVIVASAPDQGARRLGRRARDRAAPHPELRSHRWATRSRRSPTTAASGTAKPWAGACWRRWPWRGPAAR